MEMIQSHSKTNTSLCASTLIRYFPTLYAVDMVIAKHVDPQHHQKAQAHPQYHDLSSQASRIRLYPRLFQLVRDPFSPDSRCETLGSSMTPQRMSRHR